MRFFKTGPGQYGEGDQFIGVTVPDTRRVVRTFKGISLGEVYQLLQSPVHEDRLAALLLLVELFQRGDEAVRRDIYELYTNNPEHINNWDLVDTSAPQIVGGYLLDKGRDPLYDLAKSENLWLRRISILATFTFIRNDDFDDTLKISDILLDDQHDLIHKATGWMLREVGKRDEQVLTDWLDTRYSKMPRTMLRYAIERLTPDQRAHYLGKKRGVSR